MFIYLHTQHQHHQNADSCVLRLAYWNTLVAGQNLRCIGHHPGQWGQYQHQNERCCIQYRLHKKVNQISLHKYSDTSVLQLTSSVCISQLLADHCSINTAPAVITHCPPLVIDTHLHSTLILIGASHQTNSSIITVSTRNYCRRENFCYCFRTLNTQKIQLCTVSPNLDIVLLHPLSDH